MAFSRFASLNTGEISTLLSEKDSIRTKRATKQYKGIFDEYLHKKQKEYPKNGIELATILKSFYAEVRKKTGELYRVYKKKGNQTLECSKRVHYIIYRNHSFTVGKTRLLAFECHHFCAI